MSEETMNCVRVIVTALLGVCFCSSLAVAQPTSFSYQGSLTDSGGLADGVYDFRFDLFGAPTGGTSLGTSTLLSVDVVDGVFSVQLDFGAAVFDGADRYLEISTRFDGDPAFTTLTPRVPIDSVPYAIHAVEADFASYAADGPFAPEDTTPKSSSGTNPQALGVTLTVVGGQQTLDAQIEFPITITRNTQVVPPNLEPRSWQEFKVILSRPLARNSPWANYYTDWAGMFPVQIELRIDGIASPNSSTFVFQNGAVTGYRLEPENFDLHEVIEVTFLPDPSPDGMDQSPLRDFVTREVSGFTPPASGEYAPSLGGTLIRTSTYPLLYNGSAPPHTGTGRFPVERRTSFPTGPIVSEPLLMLHNVFADATNTMWDYFAITDGLPAAIGPVSINDGGGVIWQPPLNPTGGAAVTQWQLRMADDGGLFEVYQIEYLADPTP